MSLSPRQNKAARIHDHQPYQVLLTCPPRDSQVPNDSLQKHPFNCKKDRWSHLFNLVAMWKSESKPTGKVIRSKRMMCALPFWFLSALAGLEEKHRGCWDSVPAFPEGWSSLTFVSPSKRRKARVSSLRTASGNSQGCISQTDHLEFLGITWQKVYALLNLKPQHNKEF